MNLFSGFIDTRTHLCCASQPVQKTFDNHVCCGRVSINPLIFDCCNHKRYHKGTHQCFIGLSVVDRTLQCSGNQGLKPGMMCCHGIAVNMTTVFDDECCSVETPDSSEKYMTYNSSKQACDNGQIVKRQSPNDASCDGVRYEPSQEMCCNNQLYPLPEEEAECCGSTVYRKFSGTNPCRHCTEEHTRDDDVICCNNQFYYKDEDGDQCCGAEPYFSSSAVCCNGTLHFLPPSNGKSCCGKDICLLEDTSRSEVNSAVDMSLSLVSLLLCLALMNVVVLQRICSVIDCDG